MKMVVNSGIRLFFYSGDSCLMAPMLHSQKFASKLGFEVKTLVAFKYFDIFFESILGISENSAFYNSLFIYRDVFYRKLLRKNHFL